MLDAVPSALVARLFLAPHQLGRFRVRGDLRGEIIVRERVELLDADDRHVTDALGTPRREQFIIHLAAARDDAAYGHGAPCPYIFIPNHRLEAALRQFCDWRGRILAAQQALGREHDQRFAVRAQHLAAQQVEHLRRRGRDAYLDIVIGAQLQIAFDAPR